MKACLTAFGISVALLLISVGSRGQRQAISESGSKTNALPADSELGRAPEKARAKTNPLAQDPNAVAAGRLLYQRHCATCHGDNAEGKKGPSLRGEEVQSASQGAIFWLLTNGAVRRGMPVWSRLPEPQRWQLVAYIKSLPGPRAEQAQQ